LTLDLFGLQQYRLAGRVHAANCLTRDPHDVMRMGVTFAGQPLCLPPDPAAPAKPSSHIDPNATKT
jgi:hypothetical protein